MNLIDMENFEDIKVGDKVIVTNGRVKQIESVQRLTKTLVFVRYRGFRKNDGHQYGGRPFETLRICKATPEAIAEIEKEKSVMTSYLKYHVILGANYPLRNLKRCTN